MNSSKMLGRRKSDGIRPNARASMRSALGHLAYAAFKGCTLSTSIVAANAIEQAICAWPAAEPRSQ